jgi:fanconi-associated nuclease 1
LFDRFHSEGSVIRTIFGLLFFDVIFSSIPGAFETPYQSAPLDIAEDSFYFARRDLIEHRLSEIEGGGAAKIMARTDEEHRDKKTWCVGVHWDLFERRDLLEIAHVRAFASLPCNPLTCGLL